MTLKSRIDRRYGTWRGAIRLGLSYLQVATGSASIASAASSAEPRRYVFVCQGNICRSAFAHCVAESRAMNAASFGLATTTGKPADPAAVRAASRLGFDLTRHVTTAIEDFELTTGDVLLAMESRHLSRLAGHDLAHNLSRELLGSYCRPPLPHIHDPYNLGEEYFVSCFTRIIQAVGNLPRLRI